MTTILHRGVMEEYEDGVCKNRAMSFADFISDINADFSTRNFIKGGLGEQGPLYPGYRYAIKDRGRGQIFCLIAHFRSWYYTGTTSNYCHHCPYFEKQTTMLDAGGLTEVCGKGYWLQDAN